MSATLEYQRAYTRRRSLAILAAILADNFETAVMLTFRYSGEKIAPAVAASQIRWLRAQAKRIAGGPFRYVQTAMYEPSEAAKPVFRLIVQLPADVCEKLAASWFMGPAEAEPMTAEQLTAFVSELMEQSPETWPQHGATWTCSADLRRNQLHTDAAPRRLLSRCGYPPHLRRDEQQG